MRGLSLLLGLSLISIPVWSAGVPRGPIGEPPYAQEAGAAPAGAELAAPMAANNEEELVDQIEAAIGVELDQGQRAMIKDTLYKVTAEETRDDGHWFLLTCGGGQGGLMPVLPVGGQGAVCVDFSGQKYWLAGLNVGLIGGGSAQLGAILLRLFTDSPTGWYWNVQGGSSLSAAGLGITYGIDWGTSNTLMRFVWAPGVAVDGTVSSFVINKF